MLEAKQKEKLEKYWRETQGDFDWIPYVLSSVHSYPSTKATTTTTASTTSTTTTTTTTNTSSTTTTTASTTSSTPTTTDHTAARWDAAEYYGPLGVAHLPLKGFGVVATQALDAGVLLHVGAPLMTFLGAVDRGRRARVAMETSEAAEWAPRVEALSVGTDNVDEKLDEADTEARPTPDVFVIDGSDPPLLPGILEVDVDEEITTRLLSSFDVCRQPRLRWPTERKAALVIAANSFAANPALFNLLHREPRTRGREEKKEEEEEEERDKPKENTDISGLWPMAALFNHSFTPNVVWSTEGSVMTMRTSGRVERGEELTICYRQPESMVEREAFLGDYNIPMVGEVWRKRDEIEMVEAILNELDLQYKACLRHPPSADRVSVLEMIVDAVDATLEEFGGIVAGDFVESNLRFLKVQALFSLDRFDDCLDEASAMLEIEASTRGILEKWVFEIKNVLLGPPASSKERRDGVGVTASNSERVNPRAAARFEAALRKVAELRYGDVRVADIVFDNMTFFG